MKSRVFAAAAVLALVANPIAARAAGSHALIDGSGSSWAANAVNQWVADVASQGVQVVYTANGSAQGRKDYANRTTDFGVSDIPYQGTDPTTNQPDTSDGRSFAYLPIAAGGTAFPYHVEVAGHMVRNLRLSGLTLAKIFTNHITNWDDPEITHDNNGHLIGNIPIIPVVHSEGAGTTAMFTRYLATEFPSLWTPCNGVDAMTEYFPLNCGRTTGQQKALSGSDGVMNFIKSPDANGSIGIEEYSYALLAGYPAVKVLNTAGYYTLPTQYNVAVALTKAVINMNKNSPNYLTQNLDRVYINPDPRAYALSSYVYAIIPVAADDSRMTTAKRQTIADFLFYSICKGQREIGPIGYSSLPINLVEAGFTQIGKLKLADPGVDLTRRNVQTCNNPTFELGHPEINHLAQIAPLPAACDRAGAGPCTGDEGTYNTTPVGTGSTRTGSGSTVPSGTSVPGSGKKARSTGGPKSAVAATPGSTTPAANASAAQAAQVTETDISGNDSQGNGYLAPLAALLFVVILVGPAVVARRLDRGGGA